MTEQLLDILNKTSYQQFLFFSLTSQLFRFISCTQKKSQQQRRKDSSELSPLSPPSSQVQETQYKYLPLMTKAIKDELDPKWQECKLLGKNYTPRSNSAIAIHDNHLYLYGGYQQAEGILQDFYKLNMNGDSYFWRIIKCEYEPGPRCRHSLYAYKSCLYLFGGQIADSISTNEIFVHDVNQRFWKKLEINDSYPQPLDSYSSAVYSDKLFIFGGFYTSDICKHSNELYSFNFNLNNWIKLNRSKGRQPLPRDASSIAIHNQILYMFGGKNGDIRFNDLWQFDLSKQEWNSIPICGSSDIPMNRSGHSLVAYEGQLVLFGGIHDITWELDDLLTFNISKQEWKTINQDTSRRKDMEVPSPIKSNQSPQSKRKSVKFTPIIRPFNLRKSSCQSPKKVRSFTQSQQYYFPKSQNVIMNEAHKKHDSSIIPSKNHVQERRKSDCLKKKAAMLKLFDVETNKRDSFQDDCNITEKLKTSILLIGNPKQDLKLAKGTLTEFGKQIISKFILPLCNGKNVISGKKPCARDGHAIAVLENQMVLFGGDRHTMSFNDLFILNLSQI
ncbi:unnamed protein product [Paramecium octaurelia]|uniref:Kelch motif family protein n=1 Tax=Paramecium octaurelia TaxID=43137 RepID=A0A8S1YE01_PAROT|nr:unnamed protein product [Paramecium octaurelia]